MISQIERRHYLHYNRAFLKLTKLQVLRKEKSFVSLQFEPYSWASLTPGERPKALGMVEAGMNHAEVAWRLNCNHSTISHFFRRIKTTGVTHHNPRRGLPRFSNLRMDLLFRLKHFFILRVQSKHSLRREVAKVYCKFSE